ncbi:VanZ family protein [Pseudogracilibacillus sp. SO30301A]|uniref:VanZ family protein n=1 Tax=Pseudogracilibacillus sp. SO30301A TaxID=3098291 RepID=UPI00300E2F0E
MEKFRRRQKVITISLLVIYLFSLTWIILFKMTLSFNELPHLRNINLVPFSDSVIINNQIDIEEIIQNIIIFFPFGIYLNMLKPNWTFIKKVVPIASVSLLFEVLQFIFAIGATDITDFIGNTVGGIVGIGVYFMLCKLFKEKMKINKVLNILASIGTVCALGLVGLLILMN